jgi:hypothetical protein
MDSTALVTRVVMVGIATCDAATGADMPTPLPITAMSMGRAISGIGYSHVGAYTAGFNRGAEAQWLVDVHHHWAYDYARWRQLYGPTGIFAGFGGYGNGYGFGRGYGFGHRFGLGYGRGVEYEHDCNC